MCNHYRDDEKIIEFVQKTMPWVKIPGILPQIKGHMYPKYPGPVVMQAEGAQSLVEMRWGVWPFYAKDKPQFLTNARGDGLLTKAVWKQSARHRRCLVPASGYFEPGLGPVGAKGEVLFTLREQQSFFIAGLWDRDPDESGNRAFTLVTTEPNATASRFHDRMPLALTNEQAREWIGDEPMEDTRLSELLRGLPPEALSYTEIEARPREKLTIKRPEKKPAPPPDAQGSLF